MYISQVRLTGKEHTGRKRHFQHLFVTQKVGTLCKEKGGLENFFVVFFFVLGCFRFGCFHLETTRDGKTCCFRSNQTVDQSMAKHGLFD